MRVVRGHHGVIWKVIQLLDQNHITLCVCACVCACVHACACACACVCTRTRTASSFMNLRSKLIGIQLSHLEMKMAVLEEHLCLYQNKPADQLSQKSGYKQSSLKTRMSSIYPTVVEIEILHILEREKYQSSFLLVRVFR